MHGDVEVCHERDAWRVGIEGEPLQPGAYHTLEEAIEVAWVMAARLDVALHIGKERGGGAVPAWSPDRRPLRATRRPSG
jgi:hypothetical protein